jgi:beta-amylase
MKRLALLALFSLTACDLKELIGRLPQAPRTREPDGGPESSEDASKKTFAVMAPLLVGSDGVSWSDFRKQLKTFKKLGVQSVSTDIWWGIVEPEDNHFDWSRYDRLSDEIIAAGLKWVPILSFHQCGGNVGDDCDVPVPSWIWAKYVGAPGVDETRDLGFVSEQGNASFETLSPWATELALEDYAELMRAFRDRFATKARFIPEINVSLGPAGELRYPSYNAHDVGTGYPTRGGLQAYSDLAQASFRQSMVRKYSGRLQAVAAAWRRELRSWDDVQAPADADAFFAELGSEFDGDYGRDFFAWYQDSLLDHGNRLMDEAFLAFGARSSAFAKVDLGAKIPGVHWRMGERLGRLRSERRNARVRLAGREAELTAGLIRFDQAAWNSDAQGRGYRPLLRSLRRLSNRPEKNRFVVHFTCLEMNDGDGDAQALSLAKSLVGWFGAEARRQKLPLKGENALAGLLYSDFAWKNLENALDSDLYQGLTILRINELYSNDFGRAELKKLIRNFTP